MTMNTDRHARHANATRDGGWRVEVLRNATSPFIKHQLGEGKYEYKRELARVRTGEEEGVSRPWGPSRSERCVPRHVARRLPHAVRLLWPERGLQHEVFRLPLMTLVALVRRSRQARA